MNRFLSLNEVSKILDIKHKKFIQILKEEGVILNTNGRNIPIPLFISRGWFVSDIVKFSVERHNFAVQKIRVTRKGFSEISRIIDKNLFYELNSSNLFKDISIYVYDFLKFEKRNKDTIVYSNGGIDFIYLSTKTKTELILKYRQNDSKIWLPK
jgi:hypothetical protein